MQATTTMSKQNKKKPSNRYNGFACQGGFYISQIRKIAIYEFGEELFMNAKKNVAARKWDVMLYEKKKVGENLLTIDKERLKKFKDYFKKAVDVYIIPLEQADVYC